MDCTHENNLCQLLTEKLTAFRLICIETEMDRAHFFSIWILIEDVVWKGRGETARMSLPSQLERTPQLGSWWLHKVHLLCCVQARFSYFIHHTGLNCVKKTQRGISHVWAPLRNAGKLSEPVFNLSGSWKGMQRSGIFYLTTVLFPSHMDVKRGYESEHQPKSLSVGKVETHFSKLISKSFHNPHLCWSTLVVRTKYM